MEKAKRKVQVEYEAQVEDLRKFCEENTDFDVCVMEERYPYRVVYTPKAQCDMFDVDENGELSDLTVTVGISTAVKSTLRFKMNAQLLKKLIRRAERLGEIYYHAYREAADPEEQT